MKFDSYEQKVKFISTNPVGGAARIQNESEEDEYEEITGNALNAYGYHGILLNKVVQVLKALTPLG
jgi:hypothetical protein